MGRIAKGKVMVGITLEEERVATIDVRRERLRWSRAQFTKAIIERWFSEGCPPIGDADRAMVTLHGKPKQKAG